MTRIPVPGNDSRPRFAAVWICEYPYRTTRQKGPSAECGECPVWQAKQRDRRAGDRSHNILEFEGPRPRPYARQVTSAGPTEREPQPA